MRKRLFVAFLLEALFLLALFGLGLLVFYLGEGEVILGSDVDAFGKNLPELLRLGRIVEAEEGDFSLFYEGSIHRYHVLSVQERIGMALLAALHGDYGQCVCMQRSVNDVLGTAGVWTAVGSLLLALASCFGLFFHKARIGTKPRRFLIAFGGFLALIGAFTPTGNIALLPYAVTSIGALSLSVGLFDVAQTKRVNFLRSGFLYLSVAFLLLLRGLCYRSPRGDVGNVLFYALFASDTHVASVSLFFGLLPLFLPLPYARSFLPKGKESPSASN